MSVAVLQARTNSSRLPGKVLLPVKGYPIAVLAALRAANTGRDVIVATSLESSDNELSSVLKSYKLPCYRGSLENTLERIVRALDGYSDETIVFRLTADNVFPDGQLLDEIEQEFVQKKLDYLICNGMQSGVPYGMSAEVMRLRSLREAFKQSNSTHEREHVTPLIAAKYGMRYFEKYKSLKKGHYRCTIDTLDDYYCIQKVFEDVSDPVKVSCYQLIEQLKYSLYQPVGNKPTPRLVLGTAQFGMKYGIANVSGQPNKKLVTELVKTAIGNGVQFIDTARGYGDSEVVIGESLKGGWDSRCRVVTKLSPLDNCPANASKQVVSSFVDASVYQSCVALQKESLDVLLLHRAEHLTRYGGEVWKRLLALQLEGRITHLGVSVQTPDELNRVLDVKEVSFIQFPFNLLDWRWDGVIKKLILVKKRRKLTVHIRSVLLQGLLMSEKSGDWLHAHIDNYRDVMKWLVEQTKQCQRQDIVDLCLSYVNSMDWVDGVAVGLETMAQLEENVRYFINDNMTVDERKSIDETRPLLNERSLNPACWGGK